jgi:hypothetical protein
MGKDPLEFGAGDANLFRYVGNGPTDGTDPSGLKAVGHHWTPVAALTELLVEGVIDIRAFYYGMGSYTGPTSPSHNRRPQGGISEEDYRVAVKKLISSEKPVDRKIGAEQMEEIIKRIRNGVDCPDIITKYNDVVIKEIKKPMGPIGDSKTIIGLGITEAKKRVRNLELLEKYSMAFGPMFDSIRAHAEMLGVAANSANFRTFVGFLSEGKLSQAEDALVGRNTGFDGASLGGFVGDMHEHNVDPKAVASFLAEYDNVIRRGGL